MKRMSPPWKSPGYLFRAAAVLLLVCVHTPLEARLLPGFRASWLFNEQQMIIEDSPQGTRILINAPLDGFDKNDLFRKRRYFILSR